MRTKNLTAEMELAERRGELIEKKLVERQAAYLLVAMRQAALNILQAYYRRILNVKEPREAKEILREAMISLLNTIKDLPNAVSDPTWLAKVERGRRQIAPSFARVKEGKLYRSPLYSGRLADPEKRLWGLTVKQVQSSSGFSCFRLYWLLISAIRACPSGLLLQDIRSFFAKLKR